MRIIAGSCRGRKLKAVEGLKVRPTADKVKEAVFSSVNAYIYDCEFLDVFGGTGAMALEAVSKKLSLIISRCAALRKSAFY